ncbi:NAD-dependent epimerase/dehydratase family protein [bacterium]|nr:MAG: NAD-dependent epimerase/dehydratase family protein [bacterium]
MKAIVTGAAGFIGSNLCQKLLADGFSVTGIDSFTDFYPRWIKERNISPLRVHNEFEFLDQDLDDLDTVGILEGADCVFHLAAQAGVRASWGRNFDIYLKNNIRVTQKLLEASKGLPLKKFIYASSSSVYGLTPTLPMLETNPVHPLSPYGVSKLAAEQLCFLYHKNFGVPAMSLRFFTVYGPSQRPDMAFHKFFKALAEDREIAVFGDGQQTRDFTFVDDIVQASLAALVSGKPGETYNVGGGHRKKLADVIRLMEDISRMKARVLWTEKQKGDVPDTWADIRKARQDLGYSPKTRLDEGLEQEWRWIQQLYSS